ncbi:hypothetical protein BSNK01_23100 [Bacillaceae bacterium]
MHFFMELLGAGSVFRHVLSPKSFVSQYAFQLKILRKEVGEREKRPGDPRNDKNISAFGPGS